LYSARPRTFPSGDFFKRLPCARCQVEAEKRKRSASGEPIRLVSNPDRLTDEERKAEANKQAEVANLEASIKRLKLGLRQVRKCHARISFL
jgi:hypothetical protein